MRAAPDPPRPGRACATLVALLAALSGCGRLDHLGKPPEFAPVGRSGELAAMVIPGPPILGAELAEEPVRPGSLWRGSRYSLLGDRRANRRGDILTVVVSIDEEAEIENETERSRTASEGLSVPALFGLPQLINRRLPDGATLDPAVTADSNSATSGDGSVRRTEEITLRVAATVVEVLPNGHLRIEGSQEIRVNFELRELLISGVVRPEDITRQNEITHDKIAAARISYGGRGQITDVQQPRLGQQVLDILLPF